ncbi:MAG: hypothetical protein ACI90V_011338, partial [Bacillariaceae sp.]
MGWVKLVVDGKVALQTVHAFGPFLLTLLETYLENMDDSPCLDETTSSFLIAPRWMT